MGKIRITYIDDNLDPGISLFLHKRLLIEDYDLIKEQVEFSMKQAYEGLINNPVVKDTDIIIIDSKLFENDSVTDGKFTGEEFKIILKKIYPYKEVIVISQNDVDGDLGIVKKYSDAQKDEGEYYEQVLQPVIVESIKNVVLFRKLSEKLKLNENIEKTLSERIMNSISGSDEYDLLTKEDIDHVIQEFKKLQVKYE